ncbi:MAG: YicC/YloC family endoribonuclease [Planctomycetota bacterium]
MTGHGQALVRNDEIHALAEIRTVNNRFLKININGDLAPAQIAEVESAIKKHVSRGSVNLKLQTRHLNSTGEFHIDEKVLRSYAAQLHGISGTEVDLQTLLTLPGVISGDNYTAEADEEDTTWPVVVQAVNDALEKLTEMRQREGREMATDLGSNCDQIIEQLSQIEVLAPRVVDNYARKMTDRINKMLEQLGSTVTESDVVKEVGVFAERVDISEETVRLHSHVKQFREILAGEQSNGRKLDFLSQEMLRETNTIGSKANDAEIAGHVVEIKTVIERIREMVQNVE